jgi:hypothetical protein
MRDNSIFMTLKRNICGYGVHSAKKISAKYYPGQRSYDPAVCGSYD